MRWKVAEAKQRLSELLRRAASEPQEIANREQVVALVVGSKDIASFRQWQAAQRGNTLAQALSEAKQICREEGYQLPYEPRRDRDNPVLWLSDGAPRGVNDARRHKRHK